MEDDVEATAAADVEEAGVHEHAAYPKTRLLTCARQAKLMSDASPPVLMEQTFLMPAPVRQHFK